MRTCSAAAHYSSKSSSAWTAAATKTRTFPIRISVQQKKTGPGTWRTRSSSATCLPRVSPRNHGARFRRRKVRGVFTHALLAGLEQGAIDGEGQITGVSLKRPFARDPEAARQDWTRTPNPEASMTISCSLRASRRGAWP